jgi:hypothetical protein
MEDLTLALVTLTSFVLLFVVAIFADRAGADLELPTASDDPVPAPVEIAATPSPAHSHSDVA